ncbi:MAG: HPr family phosphocarrier protein [Desulfovibrionaceae bacterium]
MVGDIATTPEGLALTVRVQSPLGIHARPAARLAQEAQNFSADIRLRTGTAEADAKSMLDILSLAAAGDAEITLCASGDDAREALIRLGNLIAGIED